MRIADQSPLGLVGPAPFGGFDFVSGGLQTAIFRNATSMAH